eukprot:3886111-Amphidinium_carterae.1
MEVPSLKHTSHSIEQRTVRDRWMVIVRDSSLDNTSNNTKPSNAFTWHEMLDKRKTTNFVDKLELAILGSQASTLEAWTAIECTLSDLSSNDYDYLRLCFIDITSSSI